MLKIPENIHNSLSNFENTIIYADTRKLKRNILLTLSGILLFTFMFYDAGYINEYGLYSFYGVEALLLINILTSAIKLLTRIPAIEVDRGFLTFRSLFKSKSWRWQDIGPFKVFSRQHYFGYNHFLCAFDKKNSDLLTKYKISLIQTDVTADISLPISAFSMNGHDMSVIEFVNLLNCWQNKFGRNEIIYNSYNDEIDLYQLTRKKKLKRITDIFIRIAMMLLLTLIVFFNLYYS